MPNPSEVITNPTGFVVIMLLLLLVASLIMISRKTQQLNLPHIKGGWPILGNALQMNQYGRSDQTMEMWAKQYGPIYSVQVFNMTWVVLSGYDEIYEALMQKSRAFAGRYKYFRVSCLIFYNKNIGIGDPTQPQWMPMRKAFHRFIQPMGNNLNRVETVLIKTAQQFIAKVKSYAGKEVDLRDDINNFVLKIAIAMLIGQNVENNSQLLAEIKQFDQLVLESISPISGMELDFLPWLRFFGNPMWKKLKNVIQLRDKLFEEVWQMGKASYLSDQPPTCAIHAMAQLVDEQSSFYEPTMTREFTIGLFNDVLGTSVITTSTTSYALLNLLIHNPGVYKRLQEEVDEIVGRDRTPNIFDRESMPYTQATIFELLRFQSPLPILVPHMTLEDTSIGSHRIPAGTIVMPLVASVHHDEKFWGDPLVFRPDRFLDDDGKLLPSDHPNRKHLMQFGAGVRECVGEIFALRRLFIFIASIAQAFDLKPGDVITSCANTDYIENFMLSQKPFTARLMARNA